MCMLLRSLGLVALVGATLLGAVPAIGQTTDQGQALRFDAASGDTLRSNLWVAETVLGEAIDALLPSLPPPPTAVLLVPATTEAAANLLTAVATARLQQAGYTVHLDRAPQDDEARVVEVRYRVNKLELSYPASGRRLGLWPGWIARQMAFTAQFTVVDGADGQVLSSRRIARTFQDRFPHEYLTAVESTDYPAFTRATAPAGAWSRRLEQAIVLGTLVGLVAIYFANTE